MRGNATARKRTVREQYPTLHVKVGICGIHCNIVDTDAAHHYILKIAKKICAVLFQCPYYFLLAAYNYKKIIVALIISDCITHCPQNYGHR